METCAGQSLLSRVGSVPSASLKSACRLLDQNVTGTPGGGSVGARGT